MFIWGQSGLFTPHNSANPAELDGACCLPLLTSCSRVHYGCKQDRAICSLSPNTSNLQTVKDASSGVNGTHLFFWADAPRYEVSSAPFVNLDSQALVTPAGHALHLSDRQVRCCLKSQALK